MDRWMDDGWMNGFLQIRAALLIGPQAVHE